MKTLLLFGDCLDEMSKLPSNSIDLCLTDPPYGTTACKWDTVIPFEPMWKELKRVCKEKAAICLFGSEPFSSALRMSNIKRFRYDWVWKKNRAQGFLNAKKQPLKDNEIISVFYSKPCGYYPQGLVKKNKQIKNTGTKNATAKKVNNDRASANGAVKGSEYFQEFGNYPKRIIEFSNTGNKQDHPTQKPVPLLEYLIKTYTLEGETVLDFTMGSGSTGVACKNLGRKFIGIERDEKYYDIAKGRINEVKAKAK